MQLNTQSLFGGGPQQKLKLKKSCKAVWSGVTRDKVAPQPIIGGPLVGIGLPRTATAEAPHRAEDQDMKKHGGDAGGANVQLKARGRCHRKGPGEAVGAGKVAEDGAVPRRLAGEEKDLQSIAPKSVRDLATHLGKAAAHSLKENVALNCFKGPAGSGNRGKPIKCSKVAPGDPEKPLVLAGSGPT